MTDDPDQPTDEEEVSTSSPNGDEEPEAAPLLVLRDGLTKVVDTEPAFADVVERFAAGTGPVAIDAERASGYRYSARAYLIQLRRDGAGTALVDPIAFESMAPLQDALDGVEWILHAATQDLACLTEVGLQPAALFDTELAGRLLGYPRVGLATLVETILGKALRKEHSAVDWSTRPLPEPWLEYAALDVEVLLELREVLKQELVEAGKDEWARQEFEHLLGHEPAKKTDPWRRTSGLHKVRGRRQMAAVRALWITRDSIAAERDVTPGRILPDSAIVAAALALTADGPADKGTLQRTKGFHGRGADRYSNRWLAALKEARDLAEDELPARSPRFDGPPLPRAWADKDPVAAKRLQLARESTTGLAEKLKLPVENLLTPDYLRRVMWTPPATRDEATLTDEVAAGLAAYGARAWQVDLTTPLLVAAILGADAEPTETEADAT